VGKIKQREWTIHLGAKREGVVLQAPYEEKGGKKCKTSRTKLMDQKKGQLKRRKRGPE